MKRNGFTLIEIIIVVFMISVLFSVAVPSLLNYLDFGGESHALTEANACVTSAGYLGVMLPNQYSSQDDITYYDVVERAGVPGLVTSLKYEGKTLVSLSYQSSNGYDVLYENQTLTIQKATSIKPTNVTNILAILNRYIDSNNLNSVTNNNASSGRTQALQKLYLEEYGGVFPSLSDAELSYLTQHSYSDSSTPLGWKAMFDANGQLYLAACTRPEQTGAAMSPLIYYNNQYYYHKHSYNSDRATNKWIGEGSFVLNSDWVAL